MKLLTAIVINFGSYKYLEFNFNDIGLSLVHGPTGSGKSTLMDIPYWVLFGETSKEGNVDDVRSWKADGAPTTGILSVLDSSGSRVDITRIRGGKANDLYFARSGESPQRGKDLNDTQRLLNAALDLDESVYSTASYFTGTTKAGAFFDSGAKARREFLEHFTDLSLPRVLGDRAGNHASETRRSLGVATSTRDRLEVQARQARETHKNSEKRKASWKVDQEIQVQTLVRKVEAFEKAKEQNILSLQWHETSLQKDVARVEEKLSQIALPAPCPECGIQSKDASQAYQTLKDQRLRLIYQLAEQPKALKAAKAAVNPHTGQLEAALKATNPFFGQGEDYLVQIQRLDHDLDVADKEIAFLTAKISGLETLQDLALTLRGALLEKAVKGLQDATNLTLETYFDSEIRCTFALEDADKLAVTLDKSGYACSYRQLSKGQRQVLKLSFAVAAMEASANQAGIHFDTLFLDESFDGMDPETKVKAFRLLEYLSTSHGTVLVIDHDAGLKECFATRFQVTLNGDESSVESD